MGANYTEIDFEQLKSLFKGNLILVVTATDLETEAIHSKITPLKGYDKILRIFEGDMTYYFGMMGLYQVAHVQCSMGSIGRDSSIMTVKTAIEKINSHIVLMIGIAFGVDKEKQLIGDVLIFKYVIPYNSKRIGKIVIQRGMECQASKELLDE